MTDEAEVTHQVSPEIEQTAVQRAKHRAKAARWDLDVAVFFFAILSIVVILLSQEIGIIVVGSVAAFGLGMGWLMGWRKGKEIYQQFYHEELAELKSALESLEKGVEETVEEKIQKALRERSQ